MTEVRKFRSKLSFILDFIYLDLDVQPLKESIQLHCHANLSPLSMTTNLGDLFLYGMACKKSPARIDSVVRAPEQSQVGTRSQAHKAVGTSALGHHKLHHTRSMASILRIGCSLKQWPV